MKRCPRCGSNDVHLDQTTLPTAGEGRPRVAFEYWCRQCKLNEETVSDAADFEVVSKRWALNGPH